MFSPNLVLNYQIFSPHPLITEGNVWMMHDAITGCQRSSISLSNPCSITVRNDVLPASCYLRQNDRHKIRVSCHQKAFCERMSSMGSPQMLATSVSTGNGGKPGAHGGFIAGVWCSDGQHSPRCHRLVMATKRTTSNQAVRQNLPGRVGMKKDTLICK